MSNRLTRTDVNPSFNIFTQTNYMFQSEKNSVLEEIIQVVESSSKAEQKRMLYLLKVEKARSLARQLSKKKPARIYTDKQITELVHRVRKEYGRK